jgi:hypothetical protein
MRVAVLGCGPAGLMAAHGAIVAGADDVRIISRKRKSELFGTQYLHAPIPGMTERPAVRVDYLLHGSVEEYRTKVYGDDWHGKASPEDLDEEHDAWDIRQTYNTLWETYSDYIIDQQMDRGWVAHFLDIDARGNLGFDLIISSVPRPLTCVEGHVFPSAVIWAMGDAPERGQFVPMRDSVAPNTVICSGERDVSWYRLSKVFGYASVEWPGRVQPPFEGVARVEKPLRTNCDCHAQRDDIMFVGRYGQWEKGVLSHNAFFGAFNKVHDSTLEASNG